jgi:hypothetical protein
MTGRDGGRADTAVRLPPARPRTVQIAAVHAQRPSLQLPAAFVTANSELTLHRAAFIISHGISRDTTPRRTVSSLNST